MSEEKAMTAQAMLFAMGVHKNHKRKYTGNPYFTHLAEVAGILSTVRSDPDSIVTAWLHDCVEDCHVETALLNKIFGENVARGVIWLSDLETGNREMRKRQSRERLANAPDWVQDIKVCDLICNTSSISIHDPKFAVTYIEEKRMLLDVLTKANPILLKIAHDMIE